MSTTCWNRSAKRLLPFAIVAAIWSAPIGVSRADETIPLPAPQFETIVQYSEVLEFKGYCYKYECGRWVQHPWFERRLVPETKTLQREPTATSQIQQLQGIVANLRERVKALEDRVGITPPTNSPPTSSPPN